jgi:D-arabinitol 2-dehydrogenase
MDAMVYAAIGYHQGRPEDHDAAAITQVFAVNVFGAHLLSSACFIMAMKDTGQGSICFLGSAAGCLALPGRAAYCASKAALPRLARALAIDWAYANVRVNCVTTAVIASKPQRAVATRLPDRRAAYSRIRGISPGKAPSLESSSGTHSAG